MASLPRSSRAREKPFLVAAVMPGLLLYFGDLFMVPGYFDMEFASSLGAFFLVGFMMALLAGRRYRLEDGRRKPGFAAALLSPPVVLYTIGAVLISIAGYLSYTPKPTGH